MSDTIYANNNPTFNLSTKYSSSTTIACLGEDPSNNPTFYIQDGSVSNIFNSNGVGFCSLTGDLVQGDTNITFNSSENNMNGYFFCQVYNSTNSTYSEQRNGIFYFNSAGSDTVQHVTTNGDLNVAITSTGLQITGYTYGTEDDEFDKYIFTLIITFT